MFSLDVSPESSVIEELKSWFKHCAGRFDPGEAEDRTPPKAMYINGPVKVHLQFISRQTLNACRQRLLFHLLNFLITSGRCTQQIRGRHMFRQVFVDVSCMMQWGKSHILIRVLPAILAGDPMYGVGREREARVCRIVLQSSELSHKERLKAL